MKSLQTFVFDVVTFLIAVVAVYFILVNWPQMPESVRVPLGPFAHVLHLTNANELFADRTLTNLVLSFDADNIAVSNCNLYFTHHTKPSEGTWIGHHPYIGEYMTKCSVVCTPTNGFQD